MRPLLRPEALFVAMAFVSAAILMGLGLGLTFFSDEWAIIQSTLSGDPAALFAPHNEHWTTLAGIVYRALLGVVGLHSYVPYLGVLTGLHLLVATLVFVLIRRTSGSWVALGAGTVILLFGSGFENLYWAFQLTFVGSVATGLLAMLVLEKTPLSNRRVIAGSYLLLASLSMSGIGLICLLAVAVELLGDPTRRRAIVALAFPAGAYLIWFLLVGRTGIESHQGVFRLGSVVDAPPVILGGLAAGAGALSGVGRDLGIVVVALVVVSIGVRWIRDRRLTLAPRAAGCFAAVIALYGLIAISRAFVGPEVVDYTRYTYVSGVFLAVGIAAQVGRPSMETAWTRRAWLFVGGLAFVMAMTWNVRLLLAGRVIFEERAERTRALVTAALERPLPSTTDPSRTLVLVPSPVVLEDIVSRLGSPLTDSVVSWAVPPLSAAALESARDTLAKGAEIPLPD